MITSQGPDTDDITHLTAGLPDELQTRQNIRLASLIKQIRLHVKRLILICAVECILHAWLVYDIPEQ